MSADKAKNAERLGHRLELDEDGDVNGWAHDQHDPHAGPRCVRCGESWCWHCHPFGPRGGCRAGGWSPRRAVLWEWMRLDGACKAAVYAFRRAMER